MNLWKWGFWAAVAVLAWWAYRRFISPPTSSAGPLYGPPVPPSLNTGGSHTIGTRDQSRAAGQIYGPPAPGYPASSYIGTGTSDDAFLAAEIASLNN